MAGVISHRKAAKIQVMDASIPNPKEENDRMHVFLRAKVVPIVLSDNQNFQKFESTFQLKQEDILIQEIINLIQTYSQ